MVSECQKLRVVFFFIVYFGLRARSMSWSTPNSCENSPHMNTWLDDAQRSTPDCQFFYFAAVTLGSRRLSFFLTISGKDI